MPAAKLLIGLVFTSGWACAHLSSFVPQSSEPIPGPVVTAGQLPETLSLDALTPARVLQVQRKQGPHPSEGIDGCMAWLYRRRFMQQARNTRVSGAASDMKRYGFRSVEPLARVLARDVR